MDKNSKILADLKAGENSAYKYIYDNYYSLLCYIAYEYLEDSSLAEIIVGDVILNIWIKRETLQIHASLKYYLIQSVKNRCLNHLRSTSPALTPYAADVQDIPDLSHPLSKLIEKEIDAKLHECIQSLPKLTRTIYILHRFDNKKYSEIAEELGISQDVVKYHMKSAIARLREALKDYILLLLLIKNTFM